MRKIISSIATFLVLTIFISFAVPLGIGVIYLLHEADAHMEAELINYRDNLLDSLETELHQSVSNFEPMQVKNILRIVIQDERIISVKVYSNVYQMTLADLNKNPAYPASEQLVAKRYFGSDDNISGYIEVALDKRFQEQETAQRRLNVLLLFTGMFAFGLAMIVPLIHFKLLKPASRLISQAREITNGNMDSAFLWEGDDELSRLGNTMDHMRKELKISFERIRQLAATDELTGLPNRRSFHTYAQKALDSAARYDRSVSFALLDIDHFKRINDDFGHAIGDEVLQELSELMDKTTRKTDLVARYGGEEFVICMPETDISKARVVAEKLRETVEKHDFPHGGKVTVSIGLTSASPAMDVDRIIQQADGAMYAAKENGRNRVVVFQGD